VASLAEEQGGGTARTVSLAEFQRLELRVATVLEARPHPNADKLVLLKVRVGDRKKQIVAGIRKYREPHSLVGTRIVLADNLEPAVLRGERSEGMLLAVLDGDELALIVPDHEVRDGSLVT
jgi:methionyl-tRNA synthetase